ncbi:ABC transporter permease [Caulobacter sp. 602-1]|uniref:ABC transporter permease n=1 Tax=Caulobacter sp. 602-1 TaxID=2492472 RepID=UPI000F6437D5|nr:ABC transporter permease [Caulobacter sp. 602-1]RRN64420.1 ABC transporter permease [Caulobacter sp. 602-1]
MSRSRLSATLIVGGVISVLFVVAALLSLVWTPYDVTAFDIGHRLQGPSAAHWLGLDHFGRDIASMILLGARNALSVSLVAVLLGAGVGAPLGLLAAARRGWIDELVMRASDVVFAFPALILAILITAVLGPGAINAVIAIGVFNVPVFARLTRGSALSLWTRDYVLAARAAGKGATRISLEHIVPGLLSVLIVQATLQFSLGVIAEAGLSYVGLGAQPPAASWGKMLADAQTLVAVAPLQAIFPGLAIVITVLGLNLLGDGLRDRLDPRLDEDR